MPLFCFNNFDWLRTARGEVCGFAGKTAGWGDLAIKKEIGRDDNTC